MEHVAACSVLKVVFVVAEHETESAARIQTGCVLFCVFCVLYAVGVCVCAGVGRGGCVLCMEGDGGGVRVVGCGVCVWGGGSMCCVLCTELLLLLWLLCELFSTHFNKSKNYFELERVCFFWIFFLFLRYV
jgi:hypothetical protein